VVRIGLIAIALMLLGCGSESDGDESSSDAATTLSTDDGPYIPDVPPPAPCNMFDQDCPAGEKCVLVGCVPVLGEQAPGEVCEAHPDAGSDTCDETSMCWNLVEIDGKQLGTCSEFCQGSGGLSECPDGTSCLVTGDGGPTLCLLQCDPLVQDCGLGLGCYWASFGFNCIHTFPGIPAGEPCESISDCVPGHFCVIAEVMPDCQGVACCGPFCNLALGDPQCEVLPGTVCSSFFEQGMEPPGYEQLGVCILPP
jgi:hypothetical protein